MFVIMPESFVKSLKTVPAIIFIFLILFFISGCAGLSEETNRGFKSNTIPRMKDYAAQNQPVNPGIKPDYLKLARDLVKRGFYDVALVQLEEAGKKNPKNVEIYYLMGVCKRENREYHEAAKDFHEAIRLNPEYAPAYDGLGLTCDLMGEREKAWTNYKKAISLNPARADFYNNLGFSEILGGRFKEARLHLLKSVSLNPGYKRALNNLALCDAMVGEDKKAMAILNRILSPGDACNNMGVIYQLKGDIKKAVAMYKKALEINPGMTKAKKNLGLTDE